MKDPRLFVALATPPELCNSIVRETEPLRKAGADVKWEEPPKLHCTLRFLGPTPETLIPGLSEALATAASSAGLLQIVYRGIGAFPDLRDPRVLWIGMHDHAGAIMRLQASVESAVTSLGIQPQERAFHPHVTLGRVKGRKNLGELIRMAETVTFESPPTTVTTIELIRSDLRPSGSVYTLLRKFPLGS